jgi:transcriptional regulator with XRE-family HTH domain
MSADEGPLLRRRRLGGELKRCREAAGLTQETVSRHFEWHSAKVTRIETARVGVTARDVRDLLNLYNVHDEEYRESLIELTRKARERVWWSEYRDVMRGGNFVGLEAEATSLSLWEPTLIPGLLQTEAYMRALFRAICPSESPEAREKRVVLRRTRQGRLTGPRPLDLKVIVDESALHRVIGSSEIMTSQLCRVRDVAARLPNVTLQILPFTADVHQFLGGSVAILKFGGSADADIVYLEGFTDDYEDRPAEVARFQDGFDRLSEMALDERRSITMIDNLLRSRSVAAEDNH